MNAAREIFESLVGTKNLERKGERYANSNTQSRWKYFLLGWTIRGGK